MSPGAAAGVRPKALKLFMLVICVICSRSVWVVASSGFVMYYSYMYNQCQNALALLCFVSVRACLLIRRMSTMY